MSVSRRVVLPALVALSVLLPASAAPPAAGERLSGEVVEALQVDGYTYLRLKTASGEAWAAVPTAAVRPGARVSVERPMVMRNFESRTLKRRFDEIAFGTLAGAAAQPAAAAPPSAGTAPRPDVNEKVARAKAPNSKTVAEVVTGLATLRDQTVVVRGRVVRYSAGILGRNWVHLRDGSGRAADGSDDLLVTTRDAARVGDVVEARGKVRTDADFGSGYRYAVLLEDATLRP